MEIDFHFVRDKVATKTLNVQFYGNQEQLTNIFIKPLVDDRFSLLRLSLHVMDTPLNWGRINLPNGSTSSKISLQMIARTSIL